MSKTININTETLSPEIRQRYTEIREIVLRNPNFKEQVNSLKNAGFKVRKVDYNNEGKSLDVKFLPVRNEYYVQLGYPRPNFKYVAAVLL